MTPRTGNPETQFILKVGQVVILPKNLEKKIDKYLGKAKFEVSSLWGIDEPS